MAKTGERSAPWEEKKRRAMGNDSGIKTFAKAPDAPAGHHATTVTSVAFAKDKSAFVTAGTDGKVLMWKGSYADPEKILAAEACPAWTATAIGGTCVSGFDDGSIAKVDLDSGEKTILKGHEEAVSKLAAYGSDKFVSASRDSTALVWSLGAGDEPVLKLEGHAEGLTDVAVVEDKAVTASLDGTLKVWDLKTGKALATLKGHSLQVTCVAVVSATTVASGSADGSVRTWNVETGECLQSIDGAHSASVTGLHRVLDTKIVSTGWDGAAKVWDPATGKPVGSQMGPPKDRTTRDKENGVCASCVTEDGAKLVGTYFSKKVVVWDCKSSRVVKEKNQDKGFATAVGVDSANKVVLGLSHGEVAPLD